MNKVIVFIANNRFLHNLISFIINLVPQFIHHNISKYFSIKKIIYSINIDQVQGDYCEFGCFTGASLNHALNSYKKYMSHKKMTFYGFDSFEGFPVEVHEEFKSENFKADYNFVKKLEKKFDNCKIVKGYFKDTLKNDDIKKNINKISVTLNKDIYLHSHFGNGGVIFRYLNNSKN